MPISRILLTRGDFLCHFIVKGSGEVPNDSQLASRHSKERNQNMTDTKPKNQIEQLLREVMKTPPKGYCACGKPHLASNFKLRFCGTSSAKVLIVDYDRKASTKGAGIHHGSGGTGFRRADFFSNTILKTLSRQWLDIDLDVFYDESKIAILSIDGCCMKSASQIKKVDTTCFEELHSVIIDNLSNLNITIPIGGKSIRHTLRRHPSMTSQMGVTRAAESFEAFLPEYFPMIHPYGVSSSNFMTPAIRDKSIPALREKVHEILSTP